MSIAYGAYDSADFTRSGESGARPDAHAGRVEYRVGDRGRAPGGSKVSPAPEGAISG